MITKYSAMTTRQILIIVLFGYSSQTLIVVIIQKFENGYQTVQLINHLLKNFISHSVTYTH